MNGSRSFRSRVALAGFLAVLSLALVAGSAFAKGPGGGGSGAGASLSLVMVNDLNGDGGPNYLDDVTFNVVQTATSLPMVGLRCWQGTAWVLDGYVSFFDSRLSPKYFTLGSSYWSPALAASCTARLFYYDNRGRERLLTSLTFPVAP